jgi:hypothetical protein
MGRIAGLGADHHGEHIRQVSVDRREQRKELRQFEVLQS